MKKVLIILLVLCGIAAAQHKQRVAVLPTIAEIDAMDPQGQIRLADKVREIASKSLPIDKFILLKQDVIVNMIGEEELYRSCKEGVCIGDLTKRVSANYGVRCEVFVMNNRPALKFELYSVEEEAILETFTDYKVKDFFDMLDVLDARLPNAFKKVLSASKSREVAPAPKPAAPAAAVPKPESKPAAVSQTKSEPAPAPAVPKPEPKPAPAAAPKPENRISVGGGGFFAGDFGGGITWNGKTVLTMPYYGGGAYLFFDAVYAEVFIGYSIGSGQLKGEADGPEVDMRRAYLNAGLFAKYPFDAGAVKAFPLLGVDYEKCISFNVELPMDDLKFNSGDADVLTAVWFKFGGGLDVELSRSVYLRAELLYGFRTVNNLEKDVIELDSGRSANPGHGLNLKIGGGVKF